MVKRRLAVVLSPAIQARMGLLTVVALSTTAPTNVIPYHCEIDIPFQLPAGWASRCWVKGDMINTVGFHRTDLIRLDRHSAGTREYQTTPLPDATLRKIRQCVLRGLGLGGAAKQL